MTDCFHCASPVQDGARRAVVLGKERSFCCAGCEAVARTIVAGGFEKYYETRTAPGARPALPEAAPGPLPEGRGDEASLALEGVRCAACLWLIEHALRRVPGMRGVELNYATRRALVRWDPQRTRLPAIVAAVHAVGYRAEPYDAGRRAEAERREGRAALWRLFVAGFGAMQVMMYAFPAYVAEDLAPETAQLLRWAGLLLTAPVIAFSCAPFFRGAWSEVRAGRPGLETPIALGLAGAFAASAWATLSASGEVYFDSVSMLAFLLLAARTGEAAVRRHAARALDPLLSIAADRRIAPGERVTVAPGERIPADGVVLEGSSATDESLLTGESRPVPKRPGDEVIAGSANLDQPLVLRATRVDAQTRAAGIARLVERAASERPALVMAADRVARPLTLVVLAVAALVLLAGRDPWAAVAVLVVTCPCALALASPVVLMRASAFLLRRGVLLTRSRALASLERVTDVIVDKTGTLTEGRLAVSRTIVAGGDDEASCLALAGALEASSRHPIARAFPPPGGLEARDARYFAGKGIEARVGARRLRMGTESFCRGLCGTAFAAPVVTQAGVAYLAAPEGWLAAFELEDRLRPDAAALVRRLHARGLRVHLMSGDRPAPVAAAARATGIAAWHAGLLPEDKLARMRALQAEGRTVAMLGDGVNDGPVLAAADVSIALGSGADSTQLQADVVLLGNSLSGVLATMQAGRAAMRLVRQNIGWAIAYNAVALPAAALGLIGPLEAALGMGASSIAVLLNALRPLDAAPRTQSPWKASTSSSPSPSRSFS